MIIIGALSDSGSRGAEKLLQKKFTACGKKAITAENRKIGSEQIKYLSDAGVEYLIMTMDKEKIIPVYLDILILKDCRSITNELIKCMASDTRLIYNIDDTRKLVFAHPNAISYGMSYMAEATASSIDSSGDGISLVYCLQRPVMTLCGDIICQGERKITLPGIKPDIDEIIAAVTCSEICGMYKEN